MVVLDAAVANAGTVKSVNGHVGVVVLSATDVGADTFGSAATAQSNAEGYTDTKISAEVTRANAAYDASGSAATAQSNAEGYTDTKISAEVTRANAAYDASGSAATAQSNAEGYTDGKVPHTLAAVTSKWINSYDATTETFTATQPAYTDISGTPVLAAIATSGKWSDLKNATGALTLSNGTNGTTFNQTSAVNWAWANITAATPGITNPITSGLGATNANSSTTGASMTTHSLSMTLNVNIGDAVIVVTNCADANGTLADNGASGGNTYVKIGGNSSFYGTGQMWLCSSATKSATSITVSDAVLEVLAISAATFLNVSGVGTVVISTGGTDPMTGNVTTLNANSLVVGVMCFDGSTTVTAVSGTILTYTHNSGDVVDIAMLTKAAPTTGSYTISANHSNSTKTYEQFTVELQSTSTPVTNQSSPILALAGTAWDSVGPSSIADSWTIQDVLGSGTDGTSQLNIAHTGTTGSYGINILNPNTGVFGASTVIPALNVSVNGSKMNTEFAAIQGVNFTSSTAIPTAVYGGVTVPPSSIAFSVQSIMGCIASASTTSYVEAAYFQARALAAGTKIEASNSVADDGGFNTWSCIGHEINLGLAYQSATTPLDYHWSALSISFYGTAHPASGVNIIAGASSSPLAALVVDYSLNTAPHNMVYMVPPDNLGTTPAVRLTNHAHTYDVFDVFDDGHMALGSGSGAVDSSISRLGAASLAVGNGTAGDFSGALKLTNLSVQGTLTDGSASVGTAGQILSSTSTKVAWVNAGGAGVVATSNLTAQSASIAATTIYAVPAAGAGLYRVSYVATITTVDSTGFTLGGTTGFQAKYTNNSDSVVKTSNPTTPPVSAINATGTSISGVIYANCKASTNLQYLFTITTLTGDGRYDLSIRVEALL
jgi:hypothetical protein